MIDSVAAPLGRRAGWDTPVAAQLCGSRRWGERWLPGWGCLIWTAPGILGRMELATSCEQRLGEGLATGLLGEPANTVSAFAFVVVGLAILAGRPATGRSRWSYGLLVAAVGVGSVIQHGPHPPWQAYAHDLPLAAVLAFVAADAAGDLVGRRLPAWWWLVPTAAMVPLIMIGPVVSAAGQVVLGASAVGLGLLRARARPRPRRTLLGALALLGAGALIGTLGEQTALCQPESLLQGHAIWHLLAAAALWWLAPAIGARAGHKRSRAVASGVR